MIRRFVLALVLLAAAPAVAQTSDAVMAPITALFDGMRAADSSAVRAAFHPTASLFSVGTNEAGEAVLHETPIDRFVAAIAGEHPLYDERLGEAEVRIDGDLATVWVPYGFYVGGAFSHCGTNAFQLARLGGAWTVIHIADTRRKTDCDPAVAP
jgi:hypothetical protein